MSTLHIRYKDGTSEDIDNAFNVIDHGDGEISYFIGAAMIRYHALNVDAFEVNEAA
ncbi:hypothetical protein [Citrobacter koseri]|uniref:hypothetical protein n=1 Tax=Citrobacter koseri TaxID=545 RepID=UPI0019067F35|nr:hypothetical protein [Citrobacter koseri]MBJ8938530.1 hypothetical protein [Citrobacter koseri]